MVKVNSLSRRRGEAPFADEGLGEGSAAARADFLVVDAVPPNGSLWALNRGNPRITP